MHRLFRKYSLTLLTVFLLASCGSQQQAVLYNPIEVKQVSDRLGIALSNTNMEDDRYMPLYAEASLWMGVPYRYGGTTKAGADCSGLTFRIYQDVYRKKLPRSSAEMDKKGVRSISRNELRPGDLLFFATSGNNNRITHVGIYLKDNKFIHASTKRGVIVSDLDEKYYKQTWRRAGRVK